MKYTVVLTADYPAVARDLLAGEFDVIAHPTEDPRTEDDLIVLLGEADAAITLASDPLTRRVLEANPNLRMIANYADGTDNVDLEAARELGIVVTNTPGVRTGEAMARLAATDVHRFLRGQAPLNAVS
jgi:glyoxylate reductase